MSKETRTSSLPAVSARSRARDLALANPAFAERVWKPGQSGNPQGAIGEWQRCRALCREHSAAAAEEIIRLFRESDDDRVRFMAAQWCFERAWGKAQEFDPNAEREPLPFDASRLTSEERELLRKGLRRELDRPSGDAIPGEGGG
jgi:hypothetical protein